MDVLSATQGGERALDGQVEADYSIAFEDEICLVDLSTFNRKYSVNWSIYVTLV